MAFVTRVAEKLRARKKARGRRGSLTRFSMATKSRRERMPTATLDPTNRADTFSERRLPRANIRPPIPRARAMDPAKSKRTRFGAVSRRTAKARARAPRLRPA
jgi:hypothetical protein